MGFQGSVTLRLPRIKPGILAMGLEGGDQCLPGPGACGGAGTPLGTEVRAEEAAWLASGRVVGGGNTVIICQ